MKKYLLISATVSILGCAAHRPVKNNSDLGDTRTKKVEFLNSTTYKLTEKATDKTYGFDPGNAIKVGGMKEGTGPSNQRAYLNALLSPDGDKISYYRRGSCCAVKSPNGFDGHALLDKYAIYWDDSDTLILYINFYDKGDLLIPVGLKARKNP